MSFLLDTNVISETRRKIPDPNVRAWLDAVDERDLFVSVLTIGEIRNGIAKRWRKDRQAAAELTHWLSGIQTFFYDRIIPIDAEIAIEWGELTAGRSLPVVDALLAATARVRNFTLVTRNTRDFKSLGAPFLNPWRVI